MQKKAEELLRHGRRNEQNRASAEARTIVSLLKSCSRRKDLSAGFELHLDALERGWLDRETPHLGNALIGLYAKCGALAEAKHVLVHHPSQDVVSWNSLMSGYARQGRSEEMSACFEQMQTVGGISPDAITFTCILRACDTLERGKRIHGDVVCRSLLGKDVVLDTALVDMYVQHGELEKAQEVLEKLPVRDAVMWSTLMSGYVCHGQGENALNCFEQLQREGLLLNNVIFTLAFKACGIALAIEKGKQIHNGIASKGSLENDIVLATALMDMYSKCGAAAKAREILDDSRSRDVVSWNVVISGYVETGQAEDAFDCYSRMKNEGLCPDDGTFACILKAGSIKAELKTCKYLHSAIRSADYLGKGTTLGTALVDMYAKCHAITLAERVFEELPSRDSVAWSALISGYVQRGQSDRSLKCFEQMEMERLCPNEVTFTCTLKACGSIGAISKGQQIHAKVVGKGLLGKDLALDDALVDMYVMCGCLLEATELFDALSVRDAVLWSALIVGYARQGLVEEALNLSEGMKHEGLSPNSVTYACILKACASAGLVGKGEEISDEIVETGLHRKDIVLGTAMVDMYAKCGMPERASTVLDELPLRDVFSWSALLAGYAQHGMYDAALVCLEEMRYEGLPANNPIVFLGVLNALCHSGLMYEAQMLFVNMERECCITPELEHYICIIDSLGRAGQIERAIAVIQEMPFSEYLPVWASLLGACHKWGDVNLGRLAFDSILQLDVHNDAAYISMAGIYRAANMQGHAKVIEGMRAEVERLNKTMRTSRSIQI